MKETEDRYMPLHHLRQTLMQMHTHDQVLRAQTLATYKLKAFWTLLVLDLELKRCQWLLIGLFLYLHYPQVIQWMFILRLTVKESNFWYPEMERLSRKVLCSYLSNFITIWFATCSLLIRILVTQTLECWGMELMRVRHLWLCMERMLMLTIK